MISAACCSITQVACDLRCPWSRGLSDLCVETRTDTRGLCKVLPECPSAIDNLRNRIYPTGCGFSGREVIVCCVETESTKATAIRASTTQNPTRLTISKSRTPGEISDQMCRNYSQYVWRDIPPTKVGSNTLKFRTFVVGGSRVARKEGYALYARMGFTDIHHPEYLQEFNIIQRIAYPQYLEPSHYHDIGPAKLAQQAELNTWARPACLYPNIHSPWSKVIAIGWGKTQFGGDESKELLQVSLEVYEQPICNNVYKQETGTVQLKEGIKDDLMICAGHSKDVKDTCQGDSGGPLQVYRTGDQKMYDIIGVTSFGKGCGLDVNIPGVYTRVANYLQWLEDIVWPKSQF
ncbi:hypothetical protein D910_12224 [Dendroctonus ponderosae]|uniref:Peptidase S1 domain-containing protein n=1 Tax=Dendroctonus ponderosae TaxID=77166 RepID=U4UPA9_DENPD|nr:hypothetical protein D910_12224 [Dendroctonus ponderosae]